MTPICARAYAGAAPPVSFVPTLAHTSIGPFSKALPQLPILPGLLVTMERERIVPRENSAQLWLSC